MSTFHFIAFCLVALVNVVINIVMMFHILSLGGDLLCKDESGGRLIQSKKHGVEN